MAKKSEEVLTLLLERTRFTRDQAVTWAKKHKFSVKQVDQGKRFWRIKQNVTFRPGTGSTIVQLRRGVKAVVWT